LLELVFILLKAFLGVVVNEASVNSDLKVWACVIEDTLKKCYELASEWLGVELPEDFKVVVYKDFTIAGKVEDLALLVQVMQAGGLSKVTLIEEMKSRGLIDSTIDSAEELERIEQSGASAVFNGAQFN